MHESSYNLAKSLIEKYYKGTIVIDIGACIVEGQEASYRDFFPKEKYFGADIVPGENVHTVIPEYGWSETISADFIICGQVLEHVEMPWVFFEEIWNALNYDGIAIIIAPSSGDYHAYPKDCYRYFPEGLEGLAKHAGLECLQSGKVNAVPWNDSFIVVRKC